MKATTVIAAGLGIVAAWLYVRMRGAAPSMVDAGPPDPMTAPASPVPSNNNKRSVW